VREIVGPSDAMLEFETEIDGITVNGVDLIRWNDAGQIVDFKVMIRPLKAINLIHQRMAAMLQANQCAGSGKHDRAPTTLAPSDTLIGHRRPLSITPWTSTPQRRARP
jgi:hypothetical protein